MKKLLILIPVLMIVSLMYANTVSKSQKTWFEKYEKSENVPKPEDMLINTDPEPNISEGFVSLYNGKDLTGWVIKQGKMKFEAKGESIVGMGVKKTPSGYLCTVKDDYTNFIFTCEIK
jgi:hypothetical protein